MLPPLFVNIRVRDPQSHSVWIPLPFFLLWPLLLVLGVLALVIAVATDLVLTIVGAQFHGFTRLLVGMFGLLGVARDTSIHVARGTSIVDITIR